MSYDVVVIGSGPGGYVAAVRAAQLGFKTALIEKDSTVGGTCLNVGCIPSKALLQATELYARAGREDKKFGIEFQGLSLNFEQMMQRKCDVVHGLVTSVANLVKRYKIDLIEGVGRLISAHHIQVVKGSDSRTIEAKNIILATGSEPISLPFLPFDEKIVVSSTGALALPSIPKKLIVIGAGVIGVELASVYSRIGSEVVVVEMLDRICPATDHAISRMLMQSLKKQGITFHLSTKVVKAKQGSEGISIFIEEDQKSAVITGNVVLVAVGRRPYSQGLGLQEIGIQLSAKGFVPVNGLYRTFIPNIYAIGDLIEGPMLAHRASEEGSAVAEIIAGLHPQVHDLAIPNIIYTAPEVASVGLTEREARDAGLTIQVGTFPFRGNPRARCTGEEEGIVKVIGEAKSGRFIGMHIMGSHASEMIAEGMIAMIKKATLEDIGTAPNAHPTLSEAIKEAALDALGRAIHI